VAFYLNYLGNASLVNWEKERRKEKERKKIMG
jgi:hypothetical protein